jgi:hypothetical protein
MLQSLSDLRGLKAQARDTTIGALDDILFDDVYWCIRYLAFHCAQAHPPRYVLAAPQSVAELDRPQGRLAIDMDSRDLLAQPAFNQDLPPDRSDEAVLVQRYDWPSYWADSPVFAGSPEPSGLRPTQYSRPAAGLCHRPPELRSFSLLCGAEAHATDARAGEVVDCVFDTRDWRIRYLLIDMDSHEGAIVAPPDWVRDASWRHGRIEIDLPRETLASSPIWRRSEPPEQHA